MQNTLSYPIESLSWRSVFPALAEIPSPPTDMWIRGTLPPKDTYYLAVVGSRACTEYGKSVTDYLISGLRGYPISIVSGLALGIDGAAHSVALTHGLHTIAIPGSGLHDSVLYPRTHSGLAQKILSEGGALVSEYESHFRATKWSFPERNRIMVGIAHAVLLIEAREKSGTLITARLTAEYNRDLLVVPGNIFSTHTAGAHQFLKLGATPVTTPHDILEALGIDEDISQNPQPAQEYTPEEEAIILGLATPCEADTIIRALPYSAEVTRALLMRMVLRGVLIESSGTFSLHPDHRLRTHDN